jgi:hypothetical protein
VIDQLAQALDASASQGRFFGLAVVEWGMLLGFVSTFIGAVVKHIQASKGSRKLEAVVSALEEASREHPEALALAKRIAMEKAKSLGVESGVFGLKKDVEKHTKKLKPASE